MARVLAKPKKPAKNTFVGKPLRQPLRLEMDYAKLLELSTSEMVKDVEKAVRAFYKKPSVNRYFALDASITNQAQVMLDALERKWFSAFARMAKPASERMVGAVDAASKKGLKRSLADIGKNFSVSVDIFKGDLGEVLDATIFENVALIKSIPQEYLHSIRGFVDRSISQPDSGGIAELTESIDKFLDKRSRIIHNKAKNIALDLTRKAYNNINSARMQSAGIKEFKWIHTGGGQRPRPWHKFQLNGNTFSFRNPPMIDPKTGVHGIPGQAINCKCTMSPVVTFDF